MANTTGRKFGGRVKGTPNKPKKTVEEICKQLGFNPFELLAQVGKGDYKSLGYDSPDVVKAGKDGSVYSEERISLDQRIIAASKLAPHIAPTLKAVEMNTTIETAEEKQERIAELADQLKKIHED